MFKKILSIIKNFYKTLNSKEKFELLLPLVLISILFYFFNNKIPSDIAHNYIMSINDSSLSIMSLLVAFGLGSSTLIYSSSSESIQRAKNYYPENVVDKNNIPINYYQLLLIRIYYSLTIQVLSIFTSIIIKVFLFNAVSLFIAGLLTIILIHSILVELKFIISMYHLMWK